MDHFKETSATFWDETPSNIVHLPQNKFEVILRKEVFENKKNPADLHFGYDCKSISFSPSGSSLLIQRNGTGKTSVGPSDGPNEIEVKCDYLVAADGANSLARRSLSIPLIGEECMHTLMNIHFTCHGLLDRLQPRPAMLYFSFNEGLVSVFVAHDPEKDEWVCQIPIFPPFRNPEVRMNNISCILLPWHQVIVVITFFLSWYGIDRSNNCTDIKKHRCFSSFRNLITSVYLHRLCLPCCSKANILLRYCIFPWHHPVTKSFMYPYVLSIFIFFQGLWWSYCPATAEKGIGLFNHHCLKGEGLGDKCPLDQQLGDACPSGRHLHKQPWKCISSWRCRSQVSSSRWDFISPNAFQMLTITLHHDDISCRQIQCSVFDQNNSELLLSILMRLAWSGE